MLRQDIKVDFSFSVLEHEIVTRLAVTRLKSLANVDVVDIVDR